VRHRDELAWGPGHEPLIQKLRATRAKSRFWRAR
jgi:hypothetical protein